MMEDSHPPHYIGQHSLAIDELPETDDRNALMKNASNTKTSKDIGDLGDVESNTPPSSTKRMGTNDTQISDISKDNDDTLTTKVSQLAAITEHNHGNLVSADSKEEEEEKYPSHIDANRLSTQTEDQHSSVNV